MVYKAKELNHLLRNLTLVGYSNGKYEFMGTDKEWEKIEDKTDLVSDCCSANVDRERGICLDCKEHCNLIEN